MDIKIVSSLEKCFPDEKIESKKELEKLTMLANELSSFQIAYQNVWGGTSIPLRLRVESPALEAIELYTVGNVPSIYPEVYGRDSGFLLRNTPGLYPDLLTPYENGGLLFRSSHLLSAVWVSVASEKLAPGSYPVTFTFTDIHGAVLGERSFEFTVLAARLPDSDFKLTQWFHCDCLADSYGVEAFSEEHWHIIENFVAMAARFGINMILTPVFTPPLDTFIGGERKTVQLVGVKLENGKYSFDFSPLRRWVRMCKANGIRYFEISHLFTQWGAGHAPKIMATENGEYKRIFGWETEAAGAEYTAFLDTVLPELVACLRELGVERDCWWHISDEPSKEQLASYMKAKAVVERHLEGCEVMDALSDYDFYSSGAVKVPIPEVKHIKPFLENNVSGLWTYYCVRPAIAARLSATRIFGALFYKYNIAGFLQWGYNYYYSRDSIRYVDPYRDTSGELFVPSGDNFTVYPGECGAPYPSMRLYTFLEALQDMRALMLCEKLRGREFTLALIEETLGAPLEFNVYPEDDDFTRRLRERVNGAIAQTL